MKILVLRVINSSRQRKCFVRGYIHSLFVSKALTRSYTPRSFGFLTQTTRAYNPVQSTFYDVNYMYGLMIDPQNDQLPVGLTAQLTEPTVHFSDNLSALGIILRYTSKPERGLFIL